MTDWNGVASRAGYSLLGGIRQLVFPSAIVALLYTGVGPQVFDRLHVRTLERRHRFKVYASHEFRLFLWQGNDKCVSARANLILQSYSKSLANLLQRHYYRAIDNASE